MARGSGGESVLQRHLRVLDAFDSLHPALRLTDIARIAGLPHSTAQRLVRELESAGLLERTPDRMYRLGVRLWEYASRTPGGLGLRELARPWMNAVHSRVRQHTQLGVLSGRHVLFIDRLSTRDAVVNATLIGGRLPLPISSSGLVLLAHADETLVEEVIRIGWKIHTQFTIRDGAELRDRLARVRATGYAVLDGHVYEGSRGVAVPVLAPHGVVAAAIGVVVPNDGSASQATVELLTVAASGISKALADSYVPEGARADTTDGPIIRPLISPSSATLEYFARHGMDVADADRSHDSPQPPRRG